jgi:hypothetical protein
MMSIRLALALCLALVVIIAGIVLWFASVSKSSRAIRRQRIHTRTKPLLLLSITEAFDPIYTILWEAPIAALELIGAAGRRGIWAAQLLPIFLAAAAQFPEIYDGCSFVQWLQFLEQNQLISWDGYRVVLTPEAREFLKYRFTTDALAEV